MKPSIVVTSGLLGLFGCQLRGDRSHGLRDDAGRQARSLRLGGELSKPLQQRGARLRWRARSGSIRDNRSVVPPQGQPPFIRQDPVRFRDRIVVDTQVNRELSHRSVAVGAGEWALPGTLSTARAFRLRPADGALAPAAARTKVLTSGHALPFCLPARKVQPLAILSSADDIGRDGAAACACDVVPC
jgi:hypothetical protein